MQPYTTTDITVNGYVTFADNITLRILFKQSEPLLDQYDVYDEITVVGIIKNMEQSHNKYVVYMYDTKISSNINIENMYNGKVYLRIRNMDEYKEFLRYSHFTNIKLIVDISDIEQLNIKDFDLTIQMDKVSELKEDRLNKLVKNYKIKEILLGQIPYLSKEYFLAVLIAHSLVSAPEFAKNTFFIPVFSQSIFASLT